MNLNPALPLKYSFEWALSVVHQLHRKHARATEAVLEVLQISEKQLALYLAHDDPLWKELRDFVKRWEVYLEIHKNSGIFPGLVYFSNLYRCEKTLRIADRLDSYLKCGKFKEQGSDKGRVRKAKPTESAFLFPFLEADYDPSTVEGASGVDAEASWFIEARG